MELESLIFDMDGTLWDSADNVAESWNRVISKLDDIDITLTGDDIKGVMGLPMDVIASKFFADVAPKRQMEIMDMCGEYENEFLAAHGGQIYDGLEAALEELSGNHRLFIVSNCQSGYIEAFLEYYGFEKYFEDILCWGDNCMMKGDNIKNIMEKNGVNPETTAYVGDIQGDCDSAYYAGTKFIHAAYGFGSVDRCDASINSITELVDLVCK